MKKIIATIKENYQLMLFVLAFGLVLGWLVLPDKKSNPDTTVESHEDHDHETEETSTWTCSMHPQIRQDEPGQCPICAMDLIPLSSMESDGENTNPNEISMSESASALASVQTVSVFKEEANMKLVLQGKVQADERNVAELTARFGGRIEKLMVNYTGQEVKKGEKLATIYSPDLLTAQRELIEAALLKESRPALYKGVRSKLELWDLTEDQIIGIEESETPSANFDVRSPISGTVMKRHVSQGNYVSEGQPMFMLVDLSRVWVLFDAYEGDLPWIQKGDPVQLSFQALPGEQYRGKVAYIDPYIDQKTRVARVRIELDNQQGKLKPEMFASGILEAKLSDDRIVIPKTAVLWTGETAIVYVKVPDRDNPTFIGRQIVLGPEAGDSYLVAEGLHEGEEVVANGVFKVDAAAQLQGLKSMMNPESGMKAPGHNHGEMEITESENQNHGAMEGSNNHASFTVAGNCGMCKDRIEVAAMSVKGIKAASWDVEEQMLHLDMTSNADVMEVHKAVSEAGHDTEEMKAPDAVYDELPGCCKYDRAKEDKQKAHDHSGHDHSGHDHHH